MSAKIYFKEVVIGALILIIVTLSLKLLSLEVNFIPSWLFQNLFLGIFTLAGAFFGASQAGKYTLKSVKKQIDYQRTENRLNEIESFMKTNVEVRSRLQSTLIMIEMLIVELNKDKEEIEEQEHFDSRSWINDVLPILKEDYEAIKGLNIFSLPYETYLNFSLVIDHIDELIKFLTPIASGKRNISNRLIFLNVNKRRQLIYNFKQIIDDAETKAAEELESIKSNINN